MKLHKSGNRRAEPLAIGVTYQKSGHIPVRKTIASESLRCEQK